MSNAHRSFLNAPQHGACEAALAGLPPPDALAGALKPGASDARAALSARVLLSERHALEGCAERWKV